MNSELNPELQTIIFGSGCFWCGEAVFQRLKGVESVTVGYAGGYTTTPTYHEVSTKDTGHAEVIRVVFDADVVPLEILLDVFFATHDPTTRDRQGNDIGPQYRSIIFYTTDNQKRVIESYIQKLSNEKIFDRPIVTEVKPPANFYPAEAYHQNYYNWNTAQGYCQSVIEPKLAKLRKRFGEYLVEV